MNMRIRFLGTSNAIPTRGRNHTAILVNVENEYILIDCGEGTQRQFRFSKENLCKLTRLLITHWHGDHSLGIPGLLQTMEMSEYPRKLFIYGPKGTKTNFNLIEKLYGKIRIKHEVKEVSKEVFENKDIKIIAMPVFHETPTNAYSIIIKDKIKLNKAKLDKLKLPNSPLIAKLKEGRNITIKNKKIRWKDISKIEKGKKITVILDTQFNKRLINFAKNSEVIISEASFLDRDKEKAEKHKHLTVKQASEIAKKAKAKSLILTHISQRYEGNLIELDKEAEKIFKNTKIAKDTEEIII